MTHPPAPPTASHEPIDRAHLFDLGYALDVLEKVRDLVPFLDGDAAIGEIAAAITGLRYVIDRTKRGCTSAAPVVAPAEPTAWAHEDGRVIPASTKAAALRDGGASASSVKAYSIPLVRVQVEQPKGSVDSGSLPGTQKLWLWKNFVDGKPEYWAFDNAYPINLDNGDPQVLGEPCGYAIFKPSRQSRSRTDVSEEQILSAIARAQELS